MTTSVENLRNDNAFRQPGQIRLFFFSPAACPALLALGLHYALGDFAAAWGESADLSGTAAPAGMNARIELFSPRGDLPWT